ncbi:hypothetical protein [Paractinoplanes atraurantiacus]|uniref:Uncharacterized protein n=1 Tax=Paractinoplanes atraurantiacus TaxID=1036182 RepID=A0A285IA73_9ACTN|nr:hypothetical protein [Actinoplanes atraurantiacus]SNY44882.1 hypothetical protein SAMN05421748_107138 [Actinoplanes atraurantiacus]
MALEVAKLVVDALTPLAVVAVGYVLNRRLRKVEQAQWANQTVITRRLQIFDKLAPPLNRMLCFATFVGRWKEIQPAQVIALKREVDETMYANRLLFSDDLFTAYQAFMAAMFAMFATADADAPIRAPISRPGLGDRRNLPWWNPALQSCFSTGDPATLDEISAAYDTLSRQFRTDLYVLHSR